MQPGNPLFITTSGRSQVQPVGCIFCIKSSLFICKQIMNAYISAMRIFCNFLNKFVRIQNMFLLIVAITSSGMSLPISLMPISRNNFEGCRLVTSSKRLNTPNVMSPAIPRLITVESFDNFFQSAICVILFPRKIIRPGTTGSFSNTATRCG